MPFQPHHRLTMRGVFGQLATPFEEWSFRLNMTGAIIAGEHQAIVDAADLQWTNQLVGIVRPTARLTEIKFAAIGADGRYTADPLIKLVNKPGTALATVASPPQVANAVSLLSETRGPRGRGRIYLPAPHYGTGADDGQIDATAATNVATKVAAFLSALNAASAGLVVSVVANNSTVAPVTAVRCGRVLDTIRSRRRSIGEDYSAEVAVTT